MRTYFSVLPRCVKVDEGAGAGDEALPSVRFYDLNVVLDRLVVVIVGGAVELRRC